MAKNEGQVKQTETDRMIGDVVMYGVLGILIVISLLPVLLGMLLFAIFYSLKRDWLSYLALLMGILLLIWQFQVGHLLAYFAFLSEMNVPYLSEVIERFINQGEKIPVTSDSYITLAGLCLLFSFGFFIFSKFFWKKRVTTKSGKVQKQKAEQTYKAFRKHRVSFLNRKQKHYRRKPTKEVFIGYTDFKERVSLNSKELNYHMLATGGTGTGKTTLIASLLESALQQNKPVIFMDGKGERKSMLEFKALCEAYGKTVYLFSEMDYTYVQSDKKRHADRNTR